MSSARGAEEERRREEDTRDRKEMGDRFIKALGDQFANQRADMDVKFMPRVETEARLEHLETAVERVANAVEKLTGNVGTFHETAPGKFADKVESKQDIAELRTDLEKLKTAFDGVKERLFDYRYDEQGRRYEGDMRGERGWRKAQQQQLTITNGQLVAGAFLLITIAVNVFLALRH